MPRAFAIGSLVCAFPKKVAPKRRINAHKCNPSKGPLWSEEQCLSVARSSGIDLSGIPGYVFWAAMNMEWSDGWGVAQEFGLDVPQYYARRAEAFLRDKDAGGPMEKTGAYYRCVVCRGR